MTRSVKITAQETLAIIKGHKAFVKNIASSSPKIEAAFGWDSFDHHWAFLIKQLKDPENFRPAKRIPEDASRKKIYDPLSRKWVKFQVRREGSQKSALVNQWVTQCVNPKKGMPKPGATHTKKTSVSLLPPDGMMKLYGQTHGIVLILDSERCKVKDRYIFDRNMITNDKPWYRGAPLYEGSGNAQAIDAAHTTLDGIRGQQIEGMKQRAEEGYGQHILKWNECQVDLCTDAVMGIGVPQDNLTRRLNAQYRQLLLLKHLGRDVPLFILTSAKEISEYTVLAQQTDLLNPKSSVDREFVDAITVLRHELYFQNVANSALSSTQNIFELIELNKPEAIAALLRVFPENIFLERDKKTPLQWALEKGHLGCLKEIVREGVTEKDSAPFGEALCDAISLNKVTALRLIELGAPLNWKPSKNLSFHYRAVHYILSNGDHDLLLALLKKGGESVANRVSGEVVPLTPLIFALEKKDIKAVQLLVEYGAVLDQSAVGVLANAGRWNDLLAYCKVIFYDTEKVAEVFGWMLPIVHSINAPNVSDELLAELTDLMAQLRLLRGERIQREAVTAEALGENAALFQEFNPQRNLIKAKNMLELRDEMVGRDALSHAFDVSFFDMALLARFERRVMEDRVVLQEYAAKAKACFSEDAKQVVGDCVAKINAQIVVLDAEMSVKRFTFFGMNTSSMHHTKLQKRCVLVKTAELLGQLSSMSSVDALDGLRRVVLQNEKWNAGIGESRTGALVKRAEKLMMQYAALNAANDLAMPLSSSGDVLSSKQLAMR